MAESEEELKGLLMKVKEESEKADLNLSIQKMKIVASGKKVESDRLYFLGFQKSLWMVTAAMKLKDAYSLKGNLWPT